MLSHTDIYLGASATWVKVQGEVDALATSDLPLVLLGPTGCGKSVLAKYIHARSRRAGSLIEHAIGSVPDALSYSALLGHAGERSPAQWSSTPAWWFLPRRTRW
jgi:DNA-binding NtrC family response regulator